MKPELRFDAEAHRYLLGDDELPSVSAIIRDLSMWDLATVDRDVLEAAAAFGTRVHELTERYDRRTLMLPEFYDLPPREHRSVRAWQEFRATWHFTPITIEHRGYHPGLFYAGTIDRVGDLAGNPVVLDIKTSEPHAWHGVQLAAYLQIAVNTPVAPADDVIGGGRLLPHTASRVAVYLSDDGTYRVRRYDSADDWRTFIQEFRKWQQKKQRAERLSSSGTTWTDVYSPPSNPPSVGPEVWQ